MANDCCILISTCDRHVPLASVTGRMIERLWPDHPPLFFYGASNPPDGNWLASNAAQSDWGGLLHAALGQLRSRGYTKTYLVLDDHPPFGPCHARHLNLTLPRLMDSLGAACIGLCGWDQGHSAKGAPMGRGFHGLQHQAADFPWKFSFHPALWNLAALSAMLEHLRAQCRSPWEYERSLGTDPGIAARWGTHAYRVCGWRLTPAASPQVKHLVRLMRRKGMQALHSIRRFIGPRLQALLDASLSHDREYFAGPYPMYWSGVLRQGHLHEEALDYLTRRVSPADAADIRALFSKPAQTPTGGSL